MCAQAGGAAYMYLTCAYAHLDAVAHSVYIRMFVHTGTYMEACILGQSILGAHV